MNSFNFTRSIMIGLLGLSLIGSTEAELEWNSKAVDTEVEPGSEPITHVFEIKNTGGKPVRLQRWQSDCPCVTLNCKEDVLAAGKTAQVEAKFEVGDRIGIQQKRITIFTSDTRDSVVPFIWNIKIPEIIRIRPVFLHWAVGADPIEQQAKVELLLPGAKIRAWRLDKKGFNAVVGEDSPGILSIRARPESTSAIAQARLLVEILKSDKTIRTYSLRLMVR